MLVLFLCKIYFPYICNRILHKTLKVIKMIKRHPCNLIIFLILIFSCTTKTKISKKIPSEVKYEELKENEKKKETYKITTKKQIYSIISDFKHNCSSEDNALEFLDTCEDFLKFLESNSHLKNNAQFFLSFNRIYLSIYDLKHALVNKKRYRKYGIQDVIFNSYMCEAIENMKKELKFFLGFTKDKEATNKSTKHTDRYYKEIAKEKTYTGFSNKWIVKPFLFPGSYSASYWFIEKKLHSSYHHIKETKRKKFENILHQDINILTKDGEFINGLFCLPYNPPKRSPCIYDIPNDNSNKKVFLFFDGQVATMPDKYCSHYKHFKKLNIPCLYIDYRGYGKSTGIPTEGGIFLDAEAAFKYLVDLGYSPKNIIVCGGSLGTSPALHIASKYHVNCAIVISGFSSIENAMKERKFKKGGYFYKKKNKPLFNNVDLVKQTKCPIHVIVGKKDDWLPPKNHSKIIKKHVPKEIESTYTEIPDGDHANIWDHQKKCSKQLLNKIKEIVDNSTHTH